MFLRPSSFAALLECLALSVQAGRDVGINKKSLENLEKIQLLMVV